MPNAIFLYRVSRWFYKKKIPLIPGFFQMLIFIFYNCHISYKADIGKGTFLAHKGIASLIHNNVKIGCNTRIGMNVMITGKGPYKEVPQIGNNVWISPGVIISGAIKIEDNVIIGSNSLVIKSIPQGAIVGGVPAKIIGWVKDLDYDIMKNETWKEGFMEFLIENR